MSFFPWLIRGAGSPEGVITAPVGYLYERSDGGTGTSLYIKESGAGNTGWVAVAASGTPVSDYAGAELYGYIAHLVSDNNTSITVDTTMRGSILRTTTSSGGVTLTLPNNLPAGFIMTVIQVGTGQVTFTPASGATLSNADSHTRSQGRWAVLTLVVESNSGTDANWVLSGRTAA